MKNNISINILKKVKDGFLSLHICLHRQLNFDTSDTDISNTIDMPK